MFEAREDMAEREAGQFVGSAGPGMRKGLEARYDAERQMIVIDCFGVWTPADVDRCFDDLKGLTGMMRSRFGRVRVFVDRRKAVPQPPETVERLKTHTHVGYLPHDRIAVVVDSSFSKMQLRDQLDEQTHKTFLSENAANTWLTAHD